MSVLLVLEGVDASYGPTTVLRGVSLEVPDCGMVALLGANGAGKTTTLRAICNMGVKTRGGIRFAGKCIDRTPTEDVVRLGIGHVPEGRGTFMSLSVDENLRLGALRRRDAGIAGDIARVCEYFPVLRARMDQQAGTLSGMALGEDSAAPARDVLADVLAVFGADPGLHWQVLAARLRGTPH